MSDESRTPPPSAPPRVAIVGFGYVGACLGAALTERGVPVLGIDVDAGRVATVNAGEAPFSEPGLAEAMARAHDRGILEATTDMSRVSEAEVVLLCVGTPLDRDFAPDTQQIRAAAHELAPHLSNGQLVILKSTAPPGTTEEILAPILREGAGRKDRELLLAFCPERLAEGSALEELRTIPVVVGGVDATSRDAARSFWEESLGIETIAVRSARTAEMVKLADNQWIDLNIALANELARLSERVGVDVLEVIAAANSLPKGQHHVNILSPSMGVGGSCLTKDPWFVHRMALDAGLELRLPAAGRRVNDDMPLYAVDRIRQGLQASGRSLGDSRVAVLGLAFKSNTGDCRFSPTQPAIEALERECAELTLYDPLVTPGDAGQISSIPLSTTIEEAVRGADCIAFFTGHDAFRHVPLERFATLAPRSLIMDGRMYFSNEAIERMGELGLGFIGIGR
ncbi:MAG: nucleotide sugar dehydrogenase [Gemmatimonadales bacterium]|nr:MAG: nucleotide sugar dehydrogenase [Gemmatimonadales bacterium]